MPETIQLYRVLFAAPSDVTAELSITRRLIEDWNVQHGQTASRRLELTSWKTHSFPAAGKRPQALINRQFADRADILIAIFWRKFGSPTGKAASGTEEEIKRALKKRKPVMVYFSLRFHRERSPSEQREKARVEGFKRRFGQSALYGTYKNLTEFEKAVRKDLALVMGETARAERAPARGGARKGLTKSVYETRGLTVL